MDPEIIFSIIKLVLGGLVAFFAILLMSKTRDAAWMTIVAGFLLSYISLVYELLCHLGILTPSHLALFGIPLTSLLSVVLPSLCFIIAFIIMFFRR